jgi:hypothetical protein
MMRAKRWLSPGWIAALLSCGEQDATQVTPRPAPPPTSTATDASVSDAGPPEAIGDANPPDLDASDGSASPDLPDAYTAASRSCELGPLEQACGGLGCPALENAVEWSSSQPTTYVLQRPCEGEGGTQLISVSTSTGTFQRALVYDAASGELVSVQQISDVDEYCNELTEIGYFGAYFAACDNDSSQVPEPLPDECWNHLPLNETDAGLPGACVFILDGAGQ